MSELTMIVGVNVPEWELWHMTNSVCGVSLSDFRNSFEFVDLGDNPITARAKYDAVDGAWVGRRVVFVGRAVLVVLWLTAPPCDIRWRVGRPYLWCGLPYPCDDETIKLAIGLRLEQEMPVPQASSSAIIGV